LHNHLVINVLQNVLSGFQKA